MKQGTTPPSELLKRFREAGLDLSTLGGRVKARELTNKISRSKWTSSRLIGDRLVVFYTKGRMLSLEIRF